MVWGTRVVFIKMCVQYNTKIYSLRRMHCTCSGHTTALLAVLMYFVYYRGNTYALPETCALLSSSVVVEVGYYVCIILRGFA